MVLGLLRAIGVFVFLLVLADLTLGQFDGRIPNPESPLATAKYLLNDSVARELRLEAWQSEGIRELFESNKGSLDSLSEKGSVSFDLLLEKLNAKKAASLLRLDEIVDPKQAYRLKQLMYQIEVYQRGLGPAILDGYFGRRISISDSQMDQLSSKIARIEKEFEEKSGKLRMQSLERVLDCVPAISRAKAKEIIGEKFLVSGYGNRSRIKRIAYPFSKVRLASLLENPAIASIAKVDEKTCSDVKQFLVEHARTVREMKGKSEKSEFEKVVVTLQAIEETADEFLVKQLGPNRLSMLRSAAFQLEIVDMGAGDAVLVGSLGKAIGISDSERDASREIAKKIDTETEEGIATLAKNGLSQLLSELTPEQIKSSKDALGLEFVYVPNRAVR